MKKKYISLQEHQEILYELLYALDDFCKEHNIRYFLAHGTLLGAVRHHGIIPWDDDVDVLMERDAYDQFEKLIIKNPPKGYRVYSINNTKHYYYPFIKFGKLGTKQIETEWKCVPKEGIGINIDVFPMDGCPLDRREAEEYVTELMNSIFYNIHLWTNNDWKKVPGHIYKIYFYFRTRPLFLKLFFKLLFKKTKKYPLANSNFFYNFWSFCGTGCLHPKETIKDLIYTQFGNRKMPIPIGYDIILREQYGDYMTPPPETKQESTHKHDIYIELP